LFTKLLIGCLLAAAAFAQDRQCLACHTEQATQPSTAMAHALDQPDLHPVLAAHPNLTLAEGGYTYSVSQASGTSTYTVTRGSESLTLPIRWAFGAHSQTWVLEYQGKLYESRVSYYQEINSLAVTLGDRLAKPPESIVEAMGRQIADHEAQSCFQCHATNSATGGQMNLASLTPGVRCAHCHANTAEHLAAISKGKLTSLPPKLKQLTAEDISGFCGQCHRSFPDVVRGRLFGPLNVRFQPYRLAQSKCFNGNDARISCLGCHNPHAALVKDDATYETKCLACHSRSAVNRPAAAKVCATGASTGCVGCHMPKTQLPGGTQVFTDHYIRVARAGERYPE
jgi:hypothetical protein